MAGKPREPGPTARRVAENIRYFRRDRAVTTAGLSQRMEALGHPVPDTSITKTEKGTRRVDVDDLAAFALALGVTPNALLLPADAGTPGSHCLTPAVCATATEAWEWAQGEEPLPVPGQDTPSWADFSRRARPYLLTARNTARDAFNPGLSDLGLAALAALGGGASPAQVRRAVELAITLPGVMEPGEFAARLWELRDGKRQASTTVGADLPVRPSDA